MKQEIFMFTTLCKKTDFSDMGINWILWQCHAVYVDLPCIDEYIPLQKFALLLSF